MVQHCNRHTTSFYPCPIVVFDLYKQPCRLPHNKCQAPCRQCFTFFSVINLSATNLNSDLSKINAWVNHWKMTFNPDPNKQAQEVIFLVKWKRYYTFHWTYNSVQQVQLQKHLEVYLDGKLDFSEHLENIF